MRYIYTLIILAFLGSPLTAKIRVVTTLPVFASIAKSVGGRHVDVSSLSSGRKNPHHLTARPSFIYKLAKADVFIEAGLDLEKGWTAPLLASAGNPKIMESGAGYVRAYQGIRLLEIPTSKVDRSWGDVHIYGNPHYWLEPVNGIIIARNIKDTLVKLDPKHASYYVRNYLKFHKQVRAMTIMYLRKFKPFFGSKVVVHHREWVYLCRRFRLVEVASIEEKLGIEPTSGYVERLIRVMKKEKPKLILVSTHNPSKYARYLARKTGTPYLVLPTDLFGRNRTYQQLISSILGRILARLQQ